MKLSEILATTTPSIEGYSIEKYIDTISAHIVTGTGLFSDIGAGFRDIFGGRSAGYEKQLENINTQVMKKLKEKALRLGANGIVGVRIDFDEISGKAMQMFMVTVSGTAVQIRRSEKLESDAKHQFHINQVSADELNERYELDNIDIESENLTTDQWDLLIKYQAFDFAERILKKINAYMEKTSMTVIAAYFESYYNNAKRYFLNLSPAFSKTHLYKGIINYPHARKFIREIIKQGQLLDFENIITLLSSKDHYIRFSALKIVLYDKEFFLESDIKAIKQTIEKIKTSFPVLSQIVSEKGILGEKKFWICSLCHNQNQAKSNYCEKSSCKRDKRGFLEEDPKPENVIATLEHEIEILQSIFRG
jgi:uncharacterized protein YbjQ (UPF0145 family)